MTVTLGLAEAKQQWFWETADSIALTLLLLNVLVLVAVHARRLRQYTRKRRTKRFRARVGRILDALDPSSTVRDPHWLRKQIGEFDELERPIAATMLIERMKPASEQERRFALATLREAGAIERIVRGTKAWMPWRRALAIRTLGWIGADETLPVLVERLSDRNRQVRETAVRALGRIGDATAVQYLAPLFAAPGRVGSGVVYDALVAMGPDGEGVRRRPSVGGRVGSRRCLLRDRCARGAGDRAVRARAAARRRGGAGARRGCRVSGPGRRPRRAAGARAGRAG